MIYEELVELSDLEKDEDEPRERFIHRLLLAIDQLPDEKFETLSEEAQEYFNAAVRAHNNQESLPEFPDEKKEEITGVSRKEAKSKKGDDAIIRLLVDHNPKRKNSRSYGEFSLYRDGMTIAEYLEVGGSRAGIRWDLEKGFIALEIE